MPEPERGLASGSCENQVFAGGFLQHDVQRFSISSCGALSLGYNIETPSPTSVHPFNSSLELGSLFCGETFHTDSHYRIQVVWAT